MKILASATGLIILVFLGCHRTESRGNIDRQTEWAYQLIEQGNYGAAIDLFWHLLGKEDTPDLRLGLASALAARAGIRVHNYFDLAIPSARSEPPPEFPSTIEIKRDWSEKLRMMPPEMQGRLSPRADEIFQNHHRMEVLKWRFEQIPLVRGPDQVNDLLVARSVIKDLPSRGSHLYRALLTIILFRYQATRASESLTATLKNGQDWPCPTAMKQWFQLMPEPLNLIDDAIIDLRIAFPLKVLELNAFESDFKNHRTHIMETINALETALCRTQ